MQTASDRDLDALRERLAVRVSRYAFCLAIVPLCVANRQFLTLATAPSWTPFALSLITAAVVAFGWSGFLPASPRLRVILLLSALTAVAITSALTTGFLPGCVGGIAVVCLLGAFLVGPRAARWITGASIGWLVGVGALHSSGLTRWHAGFVPLVDLARAANWWRTGLVLAFEMAVPVPAMVEHLNALARTARRRRELLDAAVAEEQRRRESVEAEARAEADRRRAQGLHTLGRLGGGFAHACSNLLQAIRVELDLLADGVPAAGPTAAGSGVADMIEAVDAGGAVLRRLVATTDGPLSPAVEALDLPTFVRTIQRQFARIQGLTIAVTLDPCPPAMADAPSLHGVLLNLALNARDAMAGRGTLRLRARRATDAERNETGCEVGLDVADTGAGMDAATLSHLFEPFFTTKGASGTGLGLGAARRVLESAGARLHVASVVGQGTTFTILLPAASSPAPPAIPKDPPPSRAVGDRDPADDATVLVVDEDAAVRGVWQRALARHGFRVLAAKDVSEALPLVREHRVVLAWMDAVTPGPPTGDLVEELQRLQPDARLVLCSSHTDRELLRSDPRAGELPFVAKPCAVSVLLEHARRAVAAQA